MQENFPNWYREADLEADSDTLENRYSAIESYSENVNGPKCINLVRLLMGFAVDEPFINDYTMYFSKNDSAFPTRNNLLELSVLAGATIVEIIENIDKYDYIAALATISGSFLPHSNNPPVSEIISEAKDFISNQAAKLRSDLSTSSLPKIVVTKKIQTTIKQHKTSIENDEVPDHKELGKLFYEVSSEADEKVNEIARKVRKSTKTMLRAINLLSEETNILWWVFGEYSRDLNIKMKALDQEAVCMVAGKELSDLVDAAPGPLSADAFLMKIMESGRSDLPHKLILKDAINKSPREWREKWIGDREITDNLNMICPIHFAAKTSLLTEDDETWWNVYIKSNGDISLEKSPLKFAKQLYWEGLLLKSLMVGE